MNFLIVCFTSLVLAGPQVEISDIDMLEADDVNVWVNLEGPMLRLASRALAKEDADLSTLVGSLESVRVRVIEDNERLANKLRESGPKSMKQLEKKGWQAIVRVHEDDEDVYVYSRVKDDVIDGLVVLVIESDEVVFVNIVGELRPEDLDKIWELPALDSTELKEKIKQ